MNTQNQKLSSPSNDASQPLDINALFEKELNAVNAVIDDRLKSKIPLIDTIAKHLIFAGGKRLRPCLTLACAGLFGPQTPSVYALAAAVEFIHTATLLHDDVIDESETRRNLPTAHHVWGNTSSILVGDFLFARAFELMVETKHMDVLQILSQTAAIIAEGEVHQLVEIHNFSIPEDTCLAIIGSKTAQLFGAACQTGALVTGATEVQAKALFSYGYNLGLVFQITDDILDYTATDAKRGKKVGDDFREGKITLPVVYAYQKASESERQFIEQAFQATESTSEQLEQMTDLIKKYGGFEDCFSKALAFQKSALDSLESLRETGCLSPASTLIFDVLWDTAERCISRTR